MTDNWDWDDDRTVLWGVVQGRMCVQRGDVWAAKVREARAVAAVASIRQARRGHPDSPWLVDDVEAFIDDNWWEEDQPPTEFSEEDDRAYVSGLRESFVDSRLGVPSLHTPGLAWVPEQVREGVTSSSSLLDDNSFPDWADDIADRFESAGFRTVHAPEILGATTDFPDIL